MANPPPSDRFEFANQVFSEALDVHPDRRAEFVQERCASNSALCHSVLQLLDRFGTLHDFLERSPLREREPAVGTVLCHRFEILDRVGGGGMGDVFRAEDRSLREVVALKMIHSSLRHQPGVYARFCDEIRLARRVGHRNVCQIYDLFTDSSGVGPAIDFFTMEYLPGPSLAEHISAFAPLIPQAAMEIVSQVAEGLDEAHRHSIVHRDLKPANIILTDGPPVRAVITDFGLACLFETGDNSIDGHTAAGLVVGSLDYMAPEQFEGVDVGPATDVFALAIVLCELVSGSRPYPSESLVRAAIRRVSGPPSLDMLPPSVPSHWRRVLRTALARRPSDRYPTASALIRDLGPPTGASRLLSVARRRTSRRVLLTSIGGAIAAMAACREISRLHLWEPVIPAMPLIMWNSTSHDPQDKVESAAVELTLRRQLGQSARFRLLDSDRIEQSWRLMGRTEPMPAQLPPETTREVAMRAGAQIAIFSSYGKVGDRRVLSVSAELLGNDPAHPARVWLDHFDSDRPQSLQGRAGEAADWLRRTIGESEVEIAARNRTPDELTTPDWYALEEYVQGDRAWRDADPQAAELHLRSALHRDPDFASAAARLADIQRGSGQQDEALENWSYSAKVVEKRHLTDRESLRIRGLFAQDTGDYAGAAEIYARYALEYPADALPLFYRATVLARLGNYEEAERQYGLAIERDPRYAFLMGRAQFYLLRGRLEEARQDWNKARPMTPGDLSVQLEAAIAFAEANQVKWEAAMSAIAAMKTDSIPGARSRAYAVHACYLAEKRRGEAAEACLREGLAFDKSMGQSTDALQKHYLLAQLLLEGDSGRAAATAQAALKLNPGRCFRMQFGGILARAGELSAARECRVRNLPDWRVYKVWSNRLEGEISLAERKPEKAIECFRAAVEPPTVFRWPDFLVRAALAAEDYALAGGYLKELFEHSGVYWFGITQSGPGIFRYAANVVTKRKEFTSLRESIDKYKRLYDDTATQRS